MGIEFFVDWVILILSQNWNKNETPPNQIVGMRVIHSHSDSRSPFPPIKHSSKVNRASLLLLEHIIEIYLDYLFEP